jgi:hypothetical protein
MYVSVRVDFFSARNREVLVMDRTRSIAVLAVLAAFVGVSRGAEILAPDVSVNGLSQAELSVSWWQWAISYPAGSNPMTDATGEFAYLGADQAPSPHPGVFFLAGNLGDPSPRSVTILRGQTLFMPLIPVVSPIPLFGADEAAVRQDAADTIGSASGLFVRIDGLDVALPTGFGSLLDFRQLSPPGTFPFTIPTDNIFGAPEGTYEAVSDGYWVALAPLALGTYRLDFGGDGSGTPPNYGPFSNTQTYFITVVPEPSSVFLLGIGVALGLVGLRRRGARTGIFRDAT